MISSTFVFVLWKLNRMFSEPLAGTVTSPEVTVPGLGDNEIPKDNGVAPLFVAGPEFTVIPALLGKTILVHCKTPP